ncbi:MAG: hypothetical protein WDZ64_00785 [Parcubacteria group bacterium]
MVKKSLAVSFVFSIIFSSFLPTSTHKVNAQFVVSDPAHTAITGAEAARKIGKDALDFGARIAAQIAIQQIINSTVAWASSGFEGNPAYVTDPSQFFGDIADGVAGEYIMGGDLGFLCSPFQANIRVSLAQQYYQPRQFQCTLTGIVGNIEDFYSDFSSGGWDAWFSMTQTPINNPYGAFLETKIELDSRVESALSLEQDQLNWNQGFRSWSACIATNPEPWIDSPSVDGSLPSRIPNPRHEPNRAVGECIERGPTQTPGSIIKSQLDTVLPAGLDRLINVQQVDQLIDAFAAGILRRYVFGSDGLFSRNGEQVPDLGEVTPLPGSGEIPEIPTIPPGDGEGVPPPEQGLGNQPSGSNIPPIASDFSNVVWAEIDVSDWEETAFLDVSISSPAFPGSSINLNYDNANDWPADFPLGPDAELNANAWIFVYRNGSWHASTWEWMRYGQTERDTSNLYQPDAQGTLRGVLNDFSATPGDVYGFMVSCLARSSTRNCQERSNVVMVTWPGTIEGSGTGSYVGYGFPDVWINIERANRSTQFLNELQGAGGNLTFILAVTNPDVAGSNGQPWGSSAGQYDLRTPNDSFYSALASWTNKARDIGIHTMVAMYNFWMHTGSSEGWNLNPFNPNNNSNPETNCLRQNNFMAELGAAITNSTPAGSSCSNASRIFLREVWQDFTIKLSENTPSTVLFQPFSEDFKDRSFNRTSVYNQILDWWGKDEFVDNVLSHESTHSRAKYKDIHDSSRNFGLLNSFVIVNTDDRCDPILDGRITDIARETTRRNNGSGFLVYDCQVSGSSWNSTVISQIRSALNGIQPAIPK